MVISNFNRITQGTSVTQQSKPLVLKEGQVIHGSIKQLYPNQMAEVQVGSNKLMAKLEMPLKAGDSHYFQVGNTNGQLELKVVTGPMSQATASQQLTQLMDSMGLAKTAEMRQVLTHFIKNNLPMSKEQLVQAEAWVKSMNTDSGKAVALQAISRMIDFKMPFTNDVFQALIQGSKPAGMPNALMNLQQVIAQDSNIQPTLKTNIQQQIQTIQQPIQQQVTSHVLAKTIELVMDKNAALPQRIEALAFLKESGVISKQATLSNLVPNNQTPTSQQPQSTQQAQATTYGQMVAQISSSTSNPSTLAQSVSNIQQAITNDPSIQPEQKAAIIQKINEFQQSEKTPRITEQFVQQLRQQLVSAQTANTTSSEQLLSLMKQDGTPPSLPSVQQAIAQTASPLIQNLVFEAEQTVQQTIDAKQIEQMMKTIVKQLGLNYEHSIHQSKQDTAELSTQSIKPNLLSLVQDPNVSVAVKDASENVLARINGMQLLSTDNGHQHQIVMQMPLDFLGRKMDATLHWNGRMQEDGKIDANYARVLFYLNMESLQETVIDMQVQNRIVSVTVFNEQTNLQPLANVLKEKLATGLDEKGYQLSGVQMKTFEQNISPTSEQKQPNKVSKNGVDIRV